MATYMDALDGKHSDGSDAEFIDKQIKIGDFVEVEDNDETHSFVGYVEDISNNVFDGRLISVMDQEGNVWDIEAEYVKLYNA